MAHPATRTPAHAQLHAQGALPSSTSDGETNPVKRLEPLRGDAARSLLARIPLHQLRTGR